MGNAILVGLAVPEVVSVLSTMSAFALWLGVSVVLGVGEIVRQGFDEFADFAD